jgi:hypothetical protein
VTIRHPHGLANTRRTRLGAGWAPSHHVEPREYQITDGSVANGRRAQVEEDRPAAEDS